MGARTQGIQLRREVQENSRMMIKKTCSSSEQAPVLTGEVLTEDSRRAISLEKNVIVKLQFFQRALYRKPSN